MGNACYWTQKGYENPNLDQAEKKAQSLLRLLEEEKEQDFQSSRLWHSLTWQPIKTQGDPSTQTQSKNKRKREKYKLKKSQTKFMSEQQSISSLNSTPLPQKAESLKNVREEALSILLNRTVQQNKKEQRRSRNDQRFQAERKACPILLPQSERGKQTLGSRWHLKKYLDEGHFKWAPGQLIGKKSSKYEIISLMGDGTFGRVLEARNTKTGYIYAIKVIRAVARYIKRAKKEAKNVQCLNDADPDNKVPIVRLHETFAYKRNFFLVYEKLGKNLRDVNKTSGYKGFPMVIVREFARQIFQAVSHMHSQKLTHGDLKMKNILLVHDEWYYDLELEQNLPTNLEIKIIDIGNSTCHGVYRSDIIGTRAYRAPEVILQLGWNTSCNLWSVGWLLLELWSGALFFPSLDNYGALAMIQKAIGRIPIDMVKNCGSDLKNFFNTDHFLNWPRMNNRPEQLELIAQFYSIEDLVPTEHGRFRNLCNALLVYKPSKRLEAQSALSHKFFDSRYDSIN